MNDRYSIALLSIFNQVPLNGSSLHYEALKDFIRWATPREYKADDMHKMFIPVFNDITNYVISIAKK